jgi:hypothetical protein
MRPSQFFARRRTVLPDLSPLLLICMLPALPLLLAGLLGLSANPLLSTSGLAIGLKGGVLPGFPWIDPNSGTTTQALGRLAASGWLDGSMPWWNPFAGAGLPLAAEFQPAAFFLPFVLLLHFDGGVVLLRLALQITSGLFTYALLRQMRIGRFAACLGAVLYELNGVSLAPRLRVKAGETLHWRLSQLGGKRDVVVWLWPAASPDTAPQPRLTLFYETGRELAHRVFADSTATIYELPAPKPYYTVEGPCAVREQTREGLHANCTAPGLLTRREFFYPGWHTLVNGREAPLERALPIHSADESPAWASRSS